MFWQVGQVVLALARAAVLAHQPDLLAGQVSALPELLALSRAHAHGGELGGKQLLGPSAPGDATPEGIDQRLPRRDWGLARHRVLARPAGTRLGPVQFDRRRVDVLHLWNADGPDEAAPAQARAEGSTDAIAGIGNHTAKAGTGCPKPVDLHQGDVGLRQGLPVLWRYAGLGAAIGIGHPGLRQEQTQAHRYWNLTIGKREGHQHLAVGTLAQAPAVLAHHTHRTLSLLGQGGVVDHQHGIRSTDQTIRLLHQDPPQRRIVPGRARHKVMELVMAAKTQPGRRRLQAFALSWTDQPLQVDRRPQPPLPVPHGCQERREPVLQILPPVHLRHRFRPDKPSGHDNGSDSGRFCQGSARRWRLPSAGCTSP